MPLLSDGVESVANMLTDYFEHHKDSLDDSAIMALGFSTGVLLAEVEALRKDGL